MKRKVAATQSWQVALDDKEAVFSVIGGTIRCRVEDGRLRIYGIADARPGTHRDLLTIEPNTSNVVTVGLGKR